MHNDEPLSIDKPQLQAIVERVVHPVMRFTVCVVIPTRNESANVAMLATRVRAALEGEDWTMVFVDDSDDDTPEQVLAIAAEDTRVRLVHRVAAERTGGLGGAVTRGFAETSSDIVIVMDGDLQHPPETLPQLVHAFDSVDIDIAVASRHTSSGSAEGLDSGFRRLASRACQSAAYLALRRTRATTDPMSGFFAVRRDVIRDVELKPNGFKILIEILIKGQWGRCLDVPYVFGARHAGESKTDLAEARRFVAHIRTLRRDQAEHARRQVRPHRSTALTARTAESVAGPDDHALRIMIFTSESAPVISGISTCVNNLERMLDARGHAVSVVSRDNFPRFMHSELRLSAFVFSWRRFRRQLASYDVVNVHGPVPTMSEMFLLLSRTLRKHDRPTIVYTHHSDLNIPGFGPLCWIYNRLTARVAKMADAVLVSSEGYAEKFVDMGDIPVEVIPWAIDSVNKIRPRTEKMPDRVRVLFVGQLRRYKGVHVLLKAFAEAPGMELTIIGDGPERVALEKSAQAMSLTNVTFAGRVSDEELWRAYSEHDVVTLPSLTSAEAYGLVLAEGMAAGCVPVASDLPGVREVAGPTGLLVSPGSEDSLRDALMCLAQDRSMLERLAAESVERAEGMSLHATGERHEQVFRKALNRRRRSSPVVAA